MNSGPLRTNSMPDVCCICFCLFNVCLHRASVCIVGGLRPTRIRKRLQGTGVWCLPGVHEQSMQVETAVGRERVQCAAARAVGRAALCEDEPGARKLRDHCPHLGALMHSSMLVDALGYA